MVLLVLLLLSTASALQYRKDNYIFSYAVEDNYSGNQFGHTENRHGGDTAGAYHVRLPDGRLQTVQYTVDNVAGYRATVLYEGGQRKVATAPAKFVHQPQVYSGGGGGAVSQPYYSFSGPVQPHLSPAYNFINHPAPPPPSFSSHQLPYIPQPAFFTLPQEHVTVFTPHQAPSPPTLSPTSPPSPPPPPPSPPASPKPSHVAAPAPSNKHHLAFSVPLVKPPEHHKEDDIKTPDPYLVSEEELKGKSFDSPFWYPLHRHIVKGYRNKDRGDKEDHRDYKVI